MNQNSISESDCLTTAKLQAGTQTFLFATAFIIPLKPTQPVMQWVMCILLYE